jgi:phage gp29-like protein
MRKKLAQKDWDAFVEIFGIPGCVIIGPPNVPKEKEGEYRDAAEEVAEGASGYLPNGSDAKFATEPRGANPFKEHLDQQNSDLVLAGTGGKLTMLNEATGLGGGQSISHDNAFDDLAIEEAGVISELFQRQFDAEILALHHPGEPPLAYFEICAKDEEDITALADRAVKFAQAGFDMDAAELTEKSGYTLAKKETLELSPPSPGGEGLGEGGPPRLLNRAAPAAALQQLAIAFAEDLRPLRQRLERILDIEDEVILRARLEAFRAELPQLLRDINADPAAAGTLEQLLQSAVLAGAANAPAPQNRT